MTEPSSPPAQYYRNTTSNRQAARILLRQVRDLLAFHQDMGINAFPLTNHLKRFLADGPDQPGSGTGPTPKQEIRPKGRPLTEIRSTLGECVRCDLHRSRRHLVFGEGADRAGLFVIGDWPTGSDDRHGRPFTGEAGELLDRMLKAIGFTRQTVYLSTLVKCHPGGREPRTGEIATCLPFLRDQIKSVSPMVICAMGPLAARVLLKAGEPLFSLRGRFHDFEGTPLMPTFHPDFLIQNPEMKKAAWHDLQMIRKRCVP